MINLYKSLLTSSAPHEGEQELLNVIPTSITTLQIDLLVETPSFDELKEAAFNLNPLSAPSLDGLTINFFEFYWDIVGHDVHMVVESFFRGEDIPLEMLENYISLVPKSRDSIKLKDFRPISMCNVFYIIIA